METVVHEFGLSGAAASGGAPSIGVFLALILLSFAASCAAMFFFGRSMLSDRAAAAAGRGFLAEGAVFMFSDQDLVFASEEALQLLDEVDTSEKAYSRLKTYFRRHQPDLEAALERLINFGIAFSGEIELADGEFIEAEGIPRGNLATITIRSAKIDKQYLKTLEKQLKDTQARYNKLEALLEAAPLLAWRRDKDGTVTWSNRSLESLNANTRQKNGINQQILPRQFRLSERGDYNGTSGCRTSVSHKLKNGDTRETWFTVREFSLNENEIIGFANSSDELVTVETTLSRFISTLTETFAHLPTGLAIFDRKNRLTIFNPALGELTGNDPAWLATQPTFRDFMERLRERHKMPEHKNSQDWKDHIGKIQREAADGTLSEIWTLPSKQTFRITGRPHPNNAIALIIEDISTHITLEQRYRAEIEQSRTTLDFLSEAICIFDTSGDVVFSNAAFNDLWNVSAEKGNLPSNIVQATKSWSEMCAPTPIWGDLREFVTRVDDRVSWSGDVAHQDGRKFSALFAPLPDASTLTVFAPADKDDNAQSDAQSALRAEQEARAAESTILEIATSHMHEALNALSISDPKTNVAQLDYTDKLLSLRTDSIGNPNSVSALEQELLKLLADKDVNLDFSCEDGNTNAHLDATARGLLINTVLTVRSIVEKSTDIDLSVALLNEAVSVAAMFKLRSDIAPELEASAGLPFRVLMRFAKAHHGHADLLTFDETNTAKLSATIHINEPALEQEAV